MLADGSKADTGHIVGYGDMREGHRENKCGPPAGHPGQMRDCEHDEPLFFAGHMACLDWSGAGRCPGPDYWTFVDLVQSGGGEPVRAVTNHFPSWPVADPRVDQHFICIC